MVGAAAAVAALRTVCVPVGSFRQGLEEVRWGMPADSVREVLGEPDRICTHPTVAHLSLPAADSARVRAALVRSTAERWEYSDRRRGGGPPDRVVDPACRAPILATELGFDAAGRLRWIVREVEQTPVELDPALTAPSR